MSANKLKEMKEKVVGTVKEKTGELTDNAELELEGKLQQGAGKAREVADDVMDKVRDTKDDVVDSVNKKIDEVEEKIKRDKKEKEDKE